MEELQAELTSALSKFSISEFSSVIDHIFKDLFTWQDIKQVANDLKVDSKKKTIIELCVLLYQKTRPTEQQAYDTILRLQLKDVVLHKTRTWFGAKMIQPFSDSSSSLDRIDEYIVRAYKNELREAFVLKLISSNLIWLMVVEDKTVKGRTKRLKPRYFVYNLDMRGPYILYSPQSKTNYPIELVSSAFGYEQYESVPFEDKDPRSFFNLMRNKRSNAVAVRSRPSGIVPDVEDCIIDRTNHRQLEAYAQELLPVGSTSITNFKMTSTNKWRGETHAPDMSELVRLSVTIQTRNTSMERVLQEMIVRGVLDPRAPWVQQFMRAPGNIVDLQDDLNSESEEESLENSDSDS